MDGLKIRTRFKKNEPGARTGCAHHKKLAPPLAPKSIKSVPEHVPPLLSPTSPLQMRTVVNSSLFSDL